MTEFLSVLGGVMKFWSEVTWFVKLLQSTPAEKQQEVILSLQKEAQNYAQTGRPTWG